MKFKALLIIICLLVLSACGHRPDLAKDPNTTTPDYQRSQDIRSVPAEETDPLRNNDGIASADDSDLFSRIRKGFRLPDLKSKYVTEQQRWSTEHPTYIKNLFASAEPFLFYIVEEIEQRGLPMELALLPAVESAYKPNAVSRSKAAGLWQFIPSTGEHFGLRQDYWYDGRRDLIASTEAALTYLTQLNKRFEGDWFLTLAAYNAGQGTIARAIKENKRKRKKARFQDLKLRLETKRYVPKLIALRNLINNPDKFGITLPPLANGPKIELLSLSGQVDLKQFAQDTDIDLDQLKRLNAGFRRSVTPPGGPNRLVIPLQSSEGSSIALRAIENTPEIRYQRHKVVRGESLISISRQYGVTVSALQMTNQLTGTNIRAGQDLTIPLLATQHDQVNTTANESDPLSLPTTQPPETGRQLIHKVQPGETLWSIAKRYQVQLQELLNWNQISVNQVLSLNQPLLVFIN